MEDELASFNSSMLNGFHTRTVESADKDTKVLSTNDMPHTASVWPFKLLTKTFDAF
jgi:hypothetical protein